MTPLLIPLVAAALSTGYALYLYARDERAHRPRWQAEPLPSSEEPPYRHAPSPVAAGKAPTLVRWTALACLWLGPVAMVLMLIPTVFLRRAVRAMTYEPSGLLHGALLVQRLGSLLLGRDLRAMPAIDAVSPLLRMMTIPLVFFSGMFLLAERGSPALWGTLLGLGACFAALLGLLGMTRRRWSDVAPAMVADATGEANDDERG